MKSSRFSWAEQRGVTFVEVLVVLAIISLIFAVSITLLQGYVGRESFRQSVQLFTTELSDIINDVRTDIWPEVTGIRCHDDDSDGAIDYDDSDPDVLPGENRACVFIGKAVQFGSGGTVSEDSNEYFEHTLIGLSLRNDQGPEEFEVFNSSSPPIQTTRHRIVPHGGYVTKVYYVENDALRTTVANHNDPAYDDDATLADNDFVYLDGFAILLADFGEIRDSNTEDILGGSRRISIWGMTLKDASTHTEHNKSRARPDSSVFASRTDAHETTPYYHEINDRPIYICLDSGLGDKAFIKIGGEQGAITAVAEQGEAVKETLCAS